MEPAAPSPLPLLPPRGSRVAGGQSAEPAGTADLPSAVPAFPNSLPRAALIETLRQSIEKIERPVLTAAGSSSREGWRLGAFEEDGAYPQFARALETDCVHEVKPVSRAAGTSAGASAGDWMASLGFALRLAVRRLDEGDAGRRRSLLLWCWPRAFAREFGHPSWHGLLALGLDPSRVMIVETAREAEALAALEEGLKSGQIALGLGVFDCVALNPARRLSLAAAAHATPALLLTHPSSEAAAATATRWRIARAPSAPHPFDPRAPGAAKVSAALERCRAFPQGANRPPVGLEWSDETHAFRVAPRLADRASVPRRTRRRAGA